MGQGAPAADRDEYAKIGFTNRTWTLFLVSVLGLYLELLLIRWVGTEIRIFAYLQNTVLVVCFMGLGLGCLTCRKPVAIRDLLYPLLILLVLLAIPVSRGILSGISTMLSVFGGVLIWTSELSTSPVHTLLAAGQGLVLTFVLMMLIWDIFVPLGRLLGRLMDENPRTIWAYSVNVAGSLVGIWLFVLLSAFDQPPATWFVVVAALLLPLLARSASGRKRALELGLLVSVIVLAWLAGRESNAREVWWSPYQKLVLRDVAPEVKAGAPEFESIGQYLVTVNNVGYQGMIDLSEAHVAADPKRFPPELRGLSQYDMPFLLHKNPRKALLVGAGTGNDAAGALRHGVDAVTAVEIDPVIIDVGRRYHPEKPYESPHVRVVNDDARSFFATSTDRFDVISFGLLDSHTTTSMTNARLDHYVYTRESLQRARSLLSEGGIMVLSFEAQKLYIADRMASALQEVFGEPPICFRVPQTQYGWGGVVFVAGDLQGARRQLAENPRLASLIAKYQKDDPVKLTGTTRVATDDWPYIYLETASIPLLHYLLAALLLLLLVRGVSAVELKGLGRGWGRSLWHFFFLGAAFLLLEVQNISKASVVLGNTWLVNAVIISAILALVLLANFLVARFPRLPSWPVYLGLCGTSLALYFVDISRFGFLPYATKALIVGGLTSLPMLFSGIIFIRSFTSVAEKDKALGANLIGALVGGLVQSVTFVTGIRALLLIVAALYFAALLTRPRAIRDRAPANPAPDVSEHEPQPLQSTPEAQPV